MTDGFSGRSRVSSRKPVHVGRQTFQPITPQKAAAVAVFSDWDDTGFGEDGFGPAEAADIIYRNTYGSPATAVSGAGQEPPGLQTFEPVTRQDHAAVAVFAEPEDDGFGGPGTDILPPVEVVQPRQVTGASGNTVEIPVFPTNDRAAIPVPDPRELKFGHYEMPGQAQESYTAKDQSRLRSGPGAVTMPDRNPGRVRYTGLTTAPKGGRARMATPLEANQYQLDDGPLERRKKDLAAIPLVYEGIRENFGSSFEQAAEDSIWAAENPEEAEAFNRRVKAGQVEQLIPGEQKHEPYADARDSYFHKRYGDWDREKIMRTLSQDLPGAIADGWYWYTEPLSYLPRSRREKIPVLGELDLTGYMARRFQRHLGDPPPPRPKPKYTY